MAIFCSLRYFVDIELGVATSGLVAIIFNVEPMVAIFCSLRYWVCMDYRVATIGLMAIILFVAIFFQY